MNTADKAIITVNIDRQRLETLKDAFSGTSYDLLKGEFIEITQGVPIKQRNTGVRQYESPLQKTLVSSARKLLALTEGSAGIPNKEMRKLTEEIERLIKEYRR